MGTYLHNLQTDHQSSPRPTGVAMFGINPDRRSHRQTSFRLCQDQPQNGSDESASSSSGARKVLSNRRKISRNLIIPGDKCISAKA
jgi:hypothetical protein